MKDSTFLIAVLCTYILAILWDFVYDYTYVVRHYTYVVQESGAGCGTFFAPSAEWWNLGQIMFYEGDLGLGEAII